MDEDGSLYVSDEKKHEVRRYRRGDSEGIVMAGGNGRDDRLDQLYNPSYLFVDRDHSVYVSDYYNSRVVKWAKGAKVGIVVAGGPTQGIVILAGGNNAAQLEHLISWPACLSFDRYGNLYVVDARNKRIQKFTIEMPSN